MMIHRSGRQPCIEAALLLLASSLPSASAQLLGPEFQVNSYTTNAQAGAAVAADGTGKFLVVWQSDLQNGAVGSGGRGGGSLFWGVFGQRFDAAGNPAGSEFQVNTYTTGPQAYPAVAADGLGNFDVVWQSLGQDGSLEGVFGRRYNSAGAPLGIEFQVNAFTTGQQSSPAVAADGAGNFTVVWESVGQDGELSGVFGRRFNSAGTPLGSDFQINTFTTDSQGSPAVAATGAGSFVVVWMSSGGQDGSGDGVFGQRFNAAGTPLGSEFQVNTYTTGSQQRPAVDVDGSGNFVVVWSSSGGDGSNAGVFGQLFTVGGSPVGGNFQVNTYTPNNQYSPTVAADDSGEFVVAWGSGFQDGGDYGVFGQRFGAEGGTPVGSEFRVNRISPGDQGAPAVAAAGAGEFVVAFVSDGQDGSYLGVFGQRLPASAFFGDFEFTPPFWSDTTATMCAGHCVAGGTPNGICFCDNLCLGVGDCCIDACTTCGICAP
jgi:hypothetical protein